MNNKFKVGDKVVSKMQEGGQYWKGLVITEVPTRAEGCYIAKVTDKKCANPDDTGGFYEDDLSLAKAPRDYVADHARRTLRKAGLSKDEAANFVINMVAQPSACDVRPSALSRKLPKPLHEFIYDAFVWSESAEGFGYWNDISVKLNKEATINA